MHIWHILFLGSYLAFILVRLEFGSSPCQALVHRKRVYFGKHVAFFMLKVLPVVLFLRDLTFLHLVLTSLVGL